eukprot:GFUD01007911.1.p1 GENE.GFUD01007911.1~~GFUD01007911.1.p1  ORF type:complete len:263 (+),score=62.56 GFUD01007911.1:79-867(+)
MYLPLLLLICWTVGTQGQRWGYRGYRGYGRYGGYAGYGGRRRVRQNNWNLRKSPTVPITGQKSLALSVKITPDTAQVMTTPGLTTTAKQATTTSESRRQIQPLFKDTSNKSAEKKTNPYLTIDTGKFEIVPAVPGVKIPQQENKETTKGKIDVPTQFNAVQAVPRDATTTAAIETVDYGISNVDISDSVQVEDVANSVEEERFAALSQDTPDYEDGDFLSAHEVRKQFKRCHGKCVQNFCLPVGNLSVFDKCTNNCKGVCTQ